MNPRTTSSANGKVRRLAVAGLACAAALAVCLASDLVAPIARAEAADIPVAVDDHYSVGQGSEILVEMPGVLGNDQFTEGLSANFDYLTVSHGRLSFFDTAGYPGAFKYQPNPGFTGVDSFTYCVGHGTGTGECLSNKATVSITVAPIVATDDYYAVAPGVALVVDRPGVAQNDAYVDLVQQRWKVTRRPSNGTFAEGGTIPGAAFAFSYQSNAGFIGTDSFDYCVTDITTTTCLSNSATAFIQVGAPVVSRIEGADRFEVAAHIADQTHPSVSPTVYIATGANYPDALSAAPAAVRQGAPLLLVTRDGLPEVSSAEVSRLAPANIVIVGGPNSISEAVIGMIRERAPTATITRISGADRYEVSRAAALNAFGSTTHSFIATGANFPDALSAGGAAGSAAEPVILLNGAAAGVDGSTSATLSALGTASLTIVGGTNSVSLGVENSLKSTSTVTRAAGADRFEASYNVNRAAFAAATTVYLATGLNYPDALVGGVIAGRNHAPLYVVHPDCVPTNILHEIVRLGARKVVLVGGPNSLSEAVRNLTPCPA